MQKAPTFVEALKFVLTVNIQCPSLEQINTNSGKVNISARYLFELCLCPCLLYIEFSDQHVEERLNRLLPGI